MGIKSLYKFITNNNLEFPLDEKEIKNKKIAIDISILLYQVVISTRGNNGYDYLDPDGNISSHILGLFNKTILLLKRNIIPVFVFDGKPNEIKKKTLELRKNIRNKATEKLKNKMISDDDKKKYLKRSVIITESQLMDCRNLLNIMGIPYIDAPEEADSQCSYLAKYGYVDGVLTEDMDILTFGSPVLYRNLYSNKKKPKIIKLEDILKYSQLNFDEFIDWCCLLGSDYSKGIIDLNNEEILSLYKEKKNLDEIINYCNEKNYRCDCLENYKNSINYFKNPLIKNVKNKDLKLKKCDVKKLSKFLINRYGFSKNKLVNKFNYLNYRNRCFSYN